MSSYDTLPNRVATCSCAQFSLLVAGDPIGVTICNCFACQRRTGTLFSEHAAFYKEQMKIQGKSSTWSRISDVGNTVTFYFCATCAATLYFETSRIPDQVAVPVGNFNDPFFPAPRKFVYEARRHVWLPDLVPEAEHYAFRPPVAAPQPPKPGT